MSFASVSVALSFVFLAVVVGLVLRGFLGSYSVSFKKDWVVVSICVVGIVAALVGSASIFLGDPFNIMAV